MGCYPSSCWPGRHSAQPAEEVGMRGVVMGELGRWKSSIEILEKEGRRQAAQKNGKKKANVNPSETGSDEPKPASATAAERAGLSHSYKQLKEKLFPSSSKSAAGSSDNGSSTGSLEGSGGSWRTRSELLQSMTSGEYMISTDPVVFRTKLLSPPHEKERQETVDALKVVSGSQDEPHYNSIVGLAARIFKVPHSSVAIIDRSRIWMKAVHSKRSKSFEQPRETSFLAYMLLSERMEVMVVEDANEDGRFHDLMNMTKSKRRIRFFAAAPLYASNGYQIGALTIADTKPRKLDAGSFSLLSNLAEMVIRALEKEAFGPLQIPAALPPPADNNKIQAPSIQAGDSELNVQLISDLAKNQLQNVPSARRSPAEKLTLLRSTNMLETGIMVCNVDNGDGAEVLYVNDIWSQLTGIAAENACSKNLWSLFNIPGKATASVTKELQEAFLQQQTVQLTAKLQGKGNASFTLSFKSAASDSLDTDTPLVGVPSFVEFSHQRNLCYFFVAVRKAKDLICHPITAFEDAAGDELWSPRSSEGVMEEVELDAQEASEPQLEERPTTPITRKPSVPLPYNDDLFSMVQLGPLLGRGSYGKVHRGVWNNKQIAVKILETFQQGQLGDEVDDLPEAALMEEMQHQNVMQTYKHATRAKHPGNGKMVFQPQRFEDGKDDQAGGYMLETWLLLEYCNKGSLQDAIDRGWFRTEPSRAKGKPDMRIILATALELAQGLEYLHGRGLLHGDLSPGNVLLHDRPEAPHGFTVKIADFGLSRAAPNQTIKTQTFGTVTHMPPELLMDGQLTRAADVYAFGVLLWGMFTGVPPWQGMRRTQVLFKVTALGAMLQIPSNCPLLFKDLLEKCMQRDRKERPSFTDLIKELRKLLAAEERGEDLQSTPVAPPRQRRSMSIARPSLSEVTEEAPMTNAELRKTDSSRSFRKTPSLLRRPSFSQQTQLEVV